MQRHRSITKLFLSLSVLLLAASGLTQNAQAQAPPAPPKFAVFEYMKIEPGKGADYRKMEQELWMPIHRERVKAGLIRGWSLWGRRVPGGSAHEYDIVAVTTFNKWSDLENSYPPEVFAKAHPDLKYEEIIARTNPTRKMVRTEIVEFLDFAYDPKRPPDPPAKYAIFGFMKAEDGKAGEYVALERNTYKPVHQERVNQGILAGWGLLGVRLPGGTDREYSHITVNFFDKFEHMDQQYPLAVLQKALPNANWTDITVKTNAARKQVRIELMALLDLVR